jgi:hypothetical protein
MALVILGSTRCPLCDHVIVDVDEIVATSHFIADSADRLWRYSDAAMHKNCFKNWEYRERFVARYNANMGPITWGNGTYHEMELDGTILSRRRDEER